jgi:superfamily II DNA/RNA helicase
MTMYVNSFIYLIFVLAILIKENFYEQTTIFEIIQKFFFLQEIDDKIVNKKINMASLNVIEHMSNMGFSKLTPIQQLIVAPLLQGESIIVEAPHGAGKMTMICFAILKNIDVDIKACQTIISTASLDEATKILSLINGFKKDLAIQCTIMCQGSNLEELANFQIVITNTIDFIVNMNDERLSNLSMVVFKATKNGSHLRNMKKFASKCLIKSEDAPGIQTIVSTANSSNVPDNFHFRVIQWQLEDVKPNTTNASILALGFNTALPIQKCLFDTFVNGKSLIVQGPAGSGKTTAICIALVQQLKPVIRGCQVVIMTNTLESVTFIEKLLRQLSLHSNDSNESYEHKIIVGTALSVKKILSKKGFAKKNIKTIFFDSADDLLVPRSCE